MLINLATDQNKDVRIAVAENEKCSIQTLDLLSKDKNSEVRFEVAINPTTALRTLKYLINDKDENVFDAVNHSNKINHRNSI